VKLFVYLFFLLLIFSCSSVSSEYQNTPSKQIDKLLPYHTIYHKSADTTYVYTQINTEQLLYARKNQTAPFQAQFEIDIIIIKNRITQDTINYLFVDVDNNKTPKELLVKSAIHIQEGETISLILSFYDINKRDKHETNFVIDKQVNQTKDYFLITDTKTRLPIRHQIIKPNQAISVFSHSFQRDLNIRFKHNTFDLAAAPSTSNITNAITLTHDSLTTIRKENDYWLFTNDSSSGLVTLTLVGGNHQPFVLISLPVHFPKVGSYENMLEILRYITTNYEFKKLMSEPNKREAFENFWLGCTNNKEKARRLIKEYYKRAETANEFFTSYKEGWKTDKGIIYIVYGKPHHIYSDDNSETWIYGDETNPLSLRFTFEKTANIISTNNYILIRSPTYQSSWYVAIERWRDGRIY
jgi:GWxTD domain-containing protein